MLVWFYATFSQGSRCEQNLSVFVFFFLWGCTGNSVGEGPNARCRPDCVLCNRAGGRQAVASLILKNQEKGMAQGHSSWVGGGVSRGVT